MRYVVRRAEAGELPALLAIRAEVFVVEQGVPVDEEVDGYDGEAAQFVLLVDGEPCGTARWLWKGDAGKIQRVAVRASARGGGLGEALMRFVLADLALHGAAEAVLDAQEAVIPFYERLGFVAEGERFLDAGIWHRFMRLRLR